MWTEQIGKKYGMNKEMTNILLKDLGIQRRYKKIHYISPVYKGMGLVSDKQKNNLGTKDLFWTKKGIEFIDRKFASMGINKIK